MHHEQVKFIPGENSSLTFENQQICFFNKQDKNHMIIGIHLKLLKNILNFND